MDTPRNDGGARALARLLSQFQGKPRTEGIVTALALEAHDADAGLYTLWSGRQLATAAGAALDVYGQLVGESRLGREDDAYRVAIRARQALNRSSGTAPELLRILRLLAPVPLHIALVEHFPAGVALSVSNGAIFQPTAVFSVMHASKSAGVGMRLHYQDCPDAERFVTAGGVGLGFAGPPADFVGAREVVQANGTLPGDVFIDNVEWIENQGGSNLPAITFTGGPLIHELLNAAVYVVVVSGSPTFRWRWYIADGPTTGPHADNLPMWLDDLTMPPMAMLNQYPGGAYTEAGVPTGVQVQWQEEPYVVGDMVHFDVWHAPGPLAESTPPTLTAAGPLSVTGRIVVTVLHGFAFSYTVGSAPPRIASMSRPNPVPLLKADGTPSGLTITWPNVDTHYAGASWAWQVLQANPVVGGKFIHLLGG